MNIELGIAWSVALLFALLYFCGQRNFYRVLKVNKDLQKVCNDLLETCRKSGENFNKMKSISDIFSETSDGWRKLYYQAAGIKEVK